MKKPQEPPDFTRVWKDYQDTYNYLASLVNQKNEESEKIRDLIRQNNELEYIHWDDLRKEKVPFDPVAFWFVLQAIRSTKCSKIEIDDEIFSFCIPEKFQKHLFQIDKASPATFDRLFGELSHEANRELYLIDSLMEEAIASSRFEGSATARAYAKKILREGRKPRDISEQMIVNNFRTIGSLNELRDRPLSPELLTAIHMAITERTLESAKEEVKFRTSNNIVVGSRGDPAKIHNFPPDWKKIPDMIHDLCTFANNDDEHLHPIIKAIILHFLIGYIHPYTDGNGRTARALFTWYALKHHYDLFEFLSISRIFVHAPSHYPRAYQLTETDSNDMTYFIDFNLDIISSALDDLRRYLIHKKEEETESLRLREQNPNLSFRQAAMLRDFIGHPRRPYTFSELAGKYKVTLPTARTDLMLLERKGKIKKYLDGKQQVFVYNRERQGQ